MGYRLTEWPLYLCDHRIFGKESRQWHPCMTILIQYQITAFHNVSVEIIPCVYVNSTVMYYPFKELFIGLEWLGRFTISLSINSHRICSMGSFVLALNKEPENDLLSPRNHKAGGKDQGHGPQMCSPWRNPQQRRAAGPIPFDSV